jgi:PAS domain-containing protein
MLKAQTTNKSLLGVGSALEDIAKTGRVVANRGELFASAFSSSPVGMLISRLSDGIIVDANDAFLQLIECKREDAIGVKTSDLGIFRDQNQRRLLATMLAKSNIENLKQRLNLEMEKP